MLIDDYQALNQKDKKPSRFVYDQLGLNCIGRGPVMEFERYYLDLFDMLNRCCRKIASGNYDQADSDRLFELAKKGRYPGILSELAEAFGMMMVKVEAREFRLKQMIEELEETKASQKEDTDGVSKL